VTLRSGLERAALVVAIAMTASTATAQVIDTRPFRSIFKTTQDPAMSRDRLDFSAFLSGGHDQGETSFGVLGAEPDAVAADATYGHLYMHGVYAHDGRKHDFNATGSASTRYYNAAAGGLSPMWVASSARLSGELGRRGQYSLSQGFSYSPYYVYSLSPGFLSELSADSPDTMPPGFDPDTDLRSTRRATYRYDSLGSYTHRIGRYTRASVNYTFNYTDTEAPAFDMLAHRARARVTHELGRYWTVYGGYGVRLSTYRNSPFDSVIVHDLDAGFGYSRALPFSARTRVSFTMSSALIADQSTRWRLNGSAFISHLFSRNWMASGYYRRDNDVLYGFAAPFVTFSDSIGGFVAGKVPGPVYISGGVTYSRGSYSVLTVDNVSDSTWAVARVNVPIMWMLSAYSEGYYSHYEFERRVGLLPGVPTASDRVGIRFGVMVFVPVVR
jgi:hypothetical protein